MISQRIRWARGVIQSIRNTGALWTGKLSLPARLSYLNAWLYWWSFLCRMIFILAPVLFALFDVRLVVCGFWELLFFWLPAFLSNRAAMLYLGTNHPQRQVEPDHRHDPGAVSDLAGAAGVRGIRQRTFKVTDKKKRRERTASFWYLIPHGVLSVLTVAAILRFIRGKYGMALVYSSVIFFWLGYNLLGLLYAVFFMLWAGVQADLGPDRRQGAGTGGDGRGKISGL